MAKPPEKVFWSDEEKLALVMRAIELRLHKMWDSPLDVLRASMTALYDYSLRHAPPSRGESRRLKGLPPRFIKQF
jgi:hypothetical protein